METLAWNVSNKTKIIRKNNTNIKRMRNIIAIKPRLRNMVQLHVGRTSISFHDLRFYINYDRKLFLAIINLKDF